MQYALIFYDLQLILARMGYRPAPSALTFELTHLCNLACVYCDRHTPMPQEMTREQIKISLDGLQESHDAARDAGVPHVEFTCVVGRHNADKLEALVDLVEALGFTVIFQPARNSLFLDTQRDGLAWQAEVAAHRAAFAWIERRKRTSKAIANSWSSLRHFRAFPVDKPIPCSAGWIAATMEPEGNLYHCGDVNRDDRSNNVLQLGVRTAFEGLPRLGCSQCWCARTVEGNSMWGGRIDMLLPSLSR